MKSLREKVLEPEYAVAAAYLLFLVSALLSYEIPVTSKFLIRSFQDSPSLIAYLTTIFGLGVLILSIRIGSRAELKKGWPILLGVFISTSMVVYLTLKIHFVLALLAGSAYSMLLFYLSTQKDLNRLTNYVFAFALISAFTILIRGIPILSSSARAETAVSTSRALFHGFSVFSAALYVGFYETRKAAAAVAFLTLAGLLSGFKSDAIAIILSASIAGLLLHRTSIKTAGAAMVVIAVILTAVSTFIAVVAHGVWNIPPYLYPFYRFGFTFSVYSKIVEMAFPFGYLGGLAILSTTQEIMSTTVLGYTDPHIITSTLFGPLTLDFGIIGTIITALFIGIYIGLMKKYSEDSTFRTCLYAMSLTHILVLIEVGLQLSSIMFLLSMMYLSINEKTVR